MLKWRSATIIHVIIFLYILIKHFLYSWLETENIYFLIIKVWVITQEVRGYKWKFTQHVRNHVGCPNSSQNIEPHLFKGKKKKRRELLWISVRLLLLKLAMWCQLWLALAHGHFHGLYLDPAGRVWNPEISLSTKHVIMRSVELRLASGQWKHTLETKNDCKYPHFLAKFSLK